MTKKEFKDVINLMIKSHAIHQAAYDLGIDTIEFNPSDEKIIDKLWKQVLNENGYEWLSWYLYEKYGISGTPKTEIKAYDNNKEICQSVDELYKYLVKHNYFNLP